MCHFLYRRGTRGSLVSKTADEFRSKAATCEHIARQTQDQVVRQELEELARAWLRLAEHAERSDQMVQFVSRSTRKDD